MMMECKEEDDAISPSRCVLCKRQFQLEAVLKPKLLPCLHTFCSDCIQLQCKDDRFTCPLDSQECRNVLGVMDQYFVLERLKKEAMSGENGSTTVHKACEGCDTSAAENEQLTPSATAFCKQCSDWLCDSCIAAHRKVKLTKDHDILSHAEYREHAVNELGKWRFCVEHPTQMLTLFCESCQSITCRLCHSDRKHQQHPCQFLNLKASTEKSSIVRLMEEVLNKQKEAQKQHTELCRHKNDVRTLSQTTCEQIEAAFQSIIQKLEARKKHLVQTVASQCSEAEKKVDVQSERLLKVQKIMSFAVSFSQKAIAFEESFPLMMSRVALLSQLRNLTKIPVESLTVEDFDIKFNHEPNLESSFVETIGAIIVIGKESPKGSEVSSMRNMVAKLKALNPSTPSPSSPNKRPKLETPTTSSAQSANPPWIDSTPNSTKGLLMGRGGVGATRGYRKRGGFHGLTRGVRGGMGVARGVRGTAPRRGRGIKRGSVNTQMSSVNIAVPVTMSPPTSNVVMNTPDKNSRALVKMPSPIVNRSKKTLNEPVSSVVSSGHSRPPVRVSGPQSLAVPQNNALVPLSSVANQIGPPVLYQSQTSSAPILMQAGSSQCPPPQLPNQMMTPEQFQHWKNVFSQNRIDMSVLPESERARLSQIHSVMQQQIVYEKRYQEYAMRTNMVQQQQRTNGQEQMIIRTETQYRRPPAYQQSAHLVQTPSTSMMRSSSNCTNMVTNVANSSPLGDPWSRSPGFATGSSSSFFDQTPSSRQPELTLDNLHSGRASHRIDSVLVSKPQPLLALPSVTSLSRPQTAQTLMCPPVTSRSAMSYNSSKEVQCKNEVSPMSPTCAIIELAVSTNQEASQAVRRMAELTQAQATSQLDWNTRRSDSDLKSSRPSYCAEESRGLNSSPKWSTVSSSTDTPKTRPPSSEETALACELMRSVDSADEFLGCSDSEKSAPQTFDSNIIDTPTAASVEQCGGSANKSDIESVEGETIKEETSGVKAKKVSFSSSEGDPENGEGTKTGSGKRKVAEVEHEEWCAVCEDGGDMILCDTCPKIYHLDCHVPALSKPPSGDFSCNLCREQPLVIRAKVSSCASRRKSMTSDTKKLCEKLLLVMYTKRDGEDFHKPVPEEFEEYYEAIRDPIDFGIIKAKLSRSPTLNVNRGYSTVTQFLDDLHLVFTNAIHFNGPKSELGKIALDFEQHLNENAHLILGVRKRSRVTSATRKRSQKSALSDEDTVEISDSSDDNG